MPATVLKLLAAVSTDTSDSDLLARFVTERDESAFAELVRRHGPTVYRVCRRLVGPSSADDAFQATFLVLACRAKAVRKAASIGSWLIGVAGRVSRQMRRRDRSQESGDRGQTAVDHPAVSLSPDSCLLATELSAILADELTRLPDTLRDPVVLCLVEGRTQEQASAALGGSVRTLRRRLDRAKAVLQARLERRGIVPTVAAGLVAAIGSEAVAIRPRLAERAVSGVFEFLAGGPLTPAAVVAKGVVGNMARLKASAMVATVAVAMIGLGVGWANDPPSAIPPQDVPVSPPPALPDQARTPPSGRLVDDPNVVLPGLTFTYTAHARTPNFIVQAPNPVITRAVANEAEYQRAELARQWLGRELPDWKEPCEIQVTLTNDSAGGATSFEFLPETKTRPAALGTIRMELRGQFGTILESHVPHEVMHCVLATHFAKPLPRWADEGIAVAAEGAGEQINHDVRCR
ncbi:MAG TPA: RNA polymerase sigma factor, partial [Gemmataceae bacterium]|nr:RNA polymerase sigma factor [Gemmataceae bacterium]